MITPDNIKQHIAQGMKVAHLEVAGDGRHFEALIVSDEFAGKSRVQRHQHVFKVLGDRMRDEVIHALSLKTYTPQEWQNLK